MQAAIQVDLIDNGQRLRDISEATVASLINSIGDVGLLNPITVFPKKVLRAGNWIEGYGLIAGLHRKTAYERLGLVEIEANILDLDDLDRQIAECDENLCAPQLSPADRAMFTKRRKDAYEAKHPETKHGTNQHTRSSQVAKSYADDQAEKTGVHASTVRRDAARGMSVDEEALQMIRGTRFDNGTYIDKLAKMDKADQIAAAKEDIAILKRPSQLPSLQNMQRIKLDADIRTRAAKACAELIAEHLPPDAWDHFKSNLSVTTSKDLLTEFTNITGQSIIDRGAA